MGGENHSDDLVLAKTSDMSDAHGIALASCPPDFENQSLRLLAAVRSIGGQVESENE
jgi:hypothetical protein